jgi:hypothetical protein
MVLVRGFVDCDHVALVDYTAHPRLIGDVLIDIVNAEYAVA